MGDTGRGAGFLSPRRLEAIHISFNRVFESALKDGLIRNAGTYPSLAVDKNLEASGYPLSIVVNGQRAMPPVGQLMNDDQVAAVVNYVRTHFGNHYDDAVTKDEVKAIRP